MQKHLDGTQEINYLLKERVYHVLRPENSYHKEYKKERAHEKVSMKPANWKVCERFTHNLEVQVPGSKLWCHIVKSTKR